MTNLPTLSNRAKMALEVLANGGSFVHRLESNGYTGRAQFKHRLKNAEGHVVKGIGLHAFYELEGKGFLKLAPGGTSVSTYYELRTA